MIHIIATCPYCKRGVIGFDDHVDVIFNPYRGKNSPCQHLSFFWVYVMNDDWDWGRYWERGQELVELDAKVPVMELAIDITCYSVPAEDLPDVPFEVVGEPPGKKEEEEPGTGEIWVYPRGRRPVFVALYGFAVYARDAVGLVDAMYKILATAELSKTMEAAQVGDKSRKLERGQLTAGSQEDKKPKKRSAIGS